MYCLLLDLFDLFDFVLSCIHRLIPCIAYCLRNFDDLFDWSILFFYFFSRSMIGGVCFCLSVRRVCLHTCMSAASLLVASPSHGALFFRKMVWLMFVGEARGHDGCRGRQDG